MSPGCSTILLEVSPVSKIRLRLTVMVFARGGGTGSGASAAFDGALEDLFVAPDAVAGVGGAEFEGASVAGVGAPSPGPIAGGSESEGGSDSTRVMITVSPASLEMPPASARTSIKVTWRSAWKTIW